MIDLGRFEDALNVTEDFDTDTWQGSIRAWALALAGDTAGASELINALTANGIEHPIIPTVLMVLGRSTEAEAMVRATDASPEGPAVVFATGISLGNGGKLSHDPDWTPHFTALLEEAGVDLEVKQWPTPQ
jgi:hypothetical protein